MLNLRSAYYYFLATKINITKKLKKIYFRTNFYNNSLISKVPEQLYFYPNPFLLSSLTSHKNFSFKVSNIDPDMFWVKQSNEKEEKNLHNFLWLNLINRKNKDSIIQKIINVWIYKNNKYKNIIWDSAVVSKRIISWILNADIILNNTDNSFKNDFFKSIILQTNHLRKNIKFENDNCKKIEIISAILLTGLVFKDYSENYDFGIKELEKIIEIFFDNEGFPLNKNPNDLIKFSKYLILIKECIKDAQQFVPDYLGATIEKNLKCLKSIVTPHNQIPLFNGGTEINLEEYFDYISKLNYRFSKSLRKIGNLQIIKDKKNCIYFDVGEPPKKNFSSNYQSGPLSFEYFLDGDKIITNCGYGNNISKKAVLISRLTSAQSTLTINDSSVVKLERNRSINNAYGNSTKSSFKISDYNFNEDELEIKSSASHNAYENDFGYIHSREIKIDKKNNSIVGKDKLSKKKEGSKVRFSIRFHLYPGIGAVQTISGNSVLIQVKKNKSLFLISEGQNLNIEKSIFLGGNKILNNICIVISGEVSNENKEIKWEIRKNI
ncbi:MAG: hypothetical protein CBE47_00185 [Pelagibacteraceae bacterium TMED287]|nr:MAG: hypothetical protein CBE47_00185 [Pelagibacteraceae bacterium TMED287]|tara:strand:+ start:1627 stop:3273 length:1647 start_codon:yes stop_codon:yes gene_type:complete